MIRAAALLLALAAAAAPALAETLVAARTIRAQAILAPSDLKVIGADAPGALRDPAAAVGMEARRVLYEGRPIRPGDIGPPALIDRNQIVPLIYDRAGLVISTDARALSRGGEGDTIRVMNLASRTTVSGVVGIDGAVYVGGLPLP